MTTANLLERQRQILRAFRQAESEAAQGRAQEQRRQEKDIQSVQHQAQQRQTDADNYWREAQEAGALRQVAQNFTGRYASYPAVLPSEVSGPDDAAAELSRATDTARQSSMTLQKLAEFLRCWRSAHLRRRQQVWTALLIMALFALVAVLIAVWQGGQAAEYRQRAQATATAQAQFTVIVQATATAEAQATATVLAYGELLSSCQSVGQSLARPVDGMTLFCVPAGEFMMGGVKSSSYDERPVHRVALDAFWVDRTEVTNAQYQQCVHAGFCAEPNLGGRGDRPSDLEPVVGISWQDAANYCAWVGGRLPTEAEWEKAAHGTDNYTYPWGNQWEDGRCNSDESRLSKSGPVGSYPNGASPYGALDMAGNVSEWVSDWYDGSYYANSPYQNPAGPDTGFYKVVRGGSWDDDQRNVRTADRNFRDPEVRNNSIGVRCVVASGK